MTDDRIDYIKQSVDSLHIKVDKIYTDADVRLKALEIEKAHDKGLLTGAKWMATIVAGMVGGALSLAANYFTKGTH